MSLILLHLPLLIINTLIMCIYRYLVFYRLANIFNYAIILILKNFSLTFILDSLIIFIWDSITIWYVFNLCNLSLAQITCLFRHWLLHHVICSLHYIHTLITNNIFVYLCFYGINWTCFYFSNVYICYAEIE